MQRRPPGRLWEEAIAEAEAAVAIDRNFAPAYADAGFWRLFVRRAAEGFYRRRDGDQAQPSRSGPPILGIRYLSSPQPRAQWDQAIDHCRLAVVQGLPNSWIYQPDLVFVNAWLGRDADAKAALADLLKLKPDFTVKAYREVAATFSDNAVFAGIACQIWRPLCPESNRRLGRLTGVEFDRMPLMGGSFSSFS